MARKSPKCKVPPGKIKITLRKKSSPKIHLYLSKINQEKIRVGTGLPSTEPKCCYISWKKSCCIFDFFSLEKSAAGKRALGFMMRAEPGGGLMWNPRTGSVYKLNEEAYHAMIDLESGLNEWEIAKRNDLSIRSVQEMIKKLKRIC
jgi:hypothetical protein